jgi:hypothetical protein
MERAEVGLADAPSRESPFTSMTSTGTPDRRTDVIVFLVPFVRRHEALKGAPPGRPASGACVELAPLPFTATGAGTCTTGAGVTCASSARRFTLLLPRPEYSDGAIESASPCSQRKY